MLERIEKVIASLERISVSGLGAILMGEALKELLAVKAELEEKDNAND